MNNLLKKEEEKWHLSVKNWDKIIQEIDCDLADKIYKYTIMYGRCE